MENCRNLTKIIFSFLFFLIFFCHFLPNFLFNQNSSGNFQTVRIPTVFQNERICQKMNLLFSFRRFSTPKFCPKTQKVRQKNLLCKHLLATSPNGFSLLRAVDEVFYFSFLFFSFLFFSSCRTAPII